MTEDNFSRRNILYRSYQKLKNRNRKTDTPNTDTTITSIQTTATDSPKNSVSTSISHGKGFEHAPNLHNRYRTVSESVITTGPKRDEKVKKRPFSVLFSSGRRKSSPVTEPKPDHFLDVKLKPTIIVEKVSPLTTERYKLFQAVYQISLVVDDNGDIKPVVSWSYPPLGTTQDWNLALTEKTVPDFAFPDLDLLEKDTQNNLTQTYAFVQTNMKATRSIGYCRRFKYKQPHRAKDKSSSSSTQNNEDEVKVKVGRKRKQLLKIRVWCIITKLHCFDTFSAIFDEVHRLRLDLEQAHFNPDSEVFSFLKAIGVSPAPMPGHKIPIEYVSQLLTDNSMGSYEVERPVDRLNLLRLADLTNELGVKRLIHIMLALYTESKVLFLGKKLSSLTSCLHALTFLLYPLQWECIYIPMLSLSLRPLIGDLAQSPSPYVIGMLKQDYKHVKEHELKDTRVLVVDLTNKKLTDLRSEKPIPMPISLQMKKSLKADLRDARKKKDLEKQSEIWSGFIKMFMSPIDELCAASTSVDDKGYGELSISSYLEKVAQELPDCQDFAKQLLNTQMIQQYLQKRKMKLSRDD